MQKSEMLKEKAKNGKERQLEENEMISFLF